MKMTRERWIALAMGALYLLATHIEFETEVAAQKAKVYAPDPMRMGEDPDVLSW